VVEPVDPFLLQRPPPMPALKLSVAKPRRGLASGQGALIHPIPTASAETE